MKHACIHQPNGRIKTMKFKIITGIIILIIIGILIAPHFATMETVSGAVITDKERVNTRDNSKYLIWAEIRTETGVRTETFENTDSALAWKWNSSDLHGQIKVGETCDFKVNGFRVGFLSWYRNILSANCA